MALLFVIGSSVVGLAQTQTGAPPAPPVPPAPTGAPAPGSNPPPARPRSSAEVDRIPVRVDLVLSRWSGEKRVSNLPFTLMVAVTEGGDRASLRLNSQVPIPAGRPVGAGGGGNVVPITTITYKEVSTNIDAVVAIVSGNRFRLELNFSDGSVAETPQGATTDAVAGYPVLRNSSLTTTLLLRDGQPVELVVASDRVSGETIKAEVKVTTVK